MASKILSSEDIKHVIIDDNEQHVKNAQQKGTPAFHGDIFDEKVLANSTISRANSRVSYALSEGAGSLPPSARKKSFSNPFGISPGNTAVRERII